MIKRITRLATLLLIVVTLTACVEAEDGYLWAVTVDNQGVSEEYIAKTYISGNLKNSKIAYIRIFDENGKLITEVQGEGVSFTTRKVKARN